MQHGGKTDLLVEKRKLSDSVWIISYQTLKTAQKSAKGRPRSFGAFGTNGTHRSARIATNVASRQC